MPRAPRNSRLATAEARSNLPAQKEPYWHQIIEGTFLGLAKGKRGSAWVVRQRVGTGYKSRKVGHPDDKLAADGDVVLSHKQAVAVAHKIAQGAEPATRGHYGDGLTLKDSLIYLSKLHAVCVSIWNGQTDDFDEATEPGQWI